MEHEHKGRKDKCDDCGKTICELCAVDDGKGGLYCKSCFEDRTYAKNRQAHKEDYPEDFRARMFDGGI